MAGESSWTGRTCGRAILSQLAWNPAIIAVCTMADTVDAGSYCSETGRSWVLVANRACGRNGRVAQTCLIGLALVLAACNGAGGQDGDPAIDPGAGDAAPSDPGAGDAGAPSGDAGSDGSGGDGSGGDGSGGDGDGSGGDGGGSGGDGDGNGGAISGGPCLSDALGATAYRIRWANGGGTAYVVYEVNGLPDTSRDHAASYGYQIGFTPSFVDPYLGEGGLQLSSSNFVDIEISTVGLSQIESATLSLYGRSYHTTTSGSFEWQTFAGAGAAPTNLVSNVAPYQWYSADMTSEIDPGDDSVLLRIYSGPSSNSLVVNRIELCLQAQ